jgi:integrase
VSAPLVFPSAKTGRAVGGFSKFMSKLRAAADIGPWKIHDTRRTCRTLMSRLGVPEPYAELAIGHVKATLIAIYNLDEQWATRVDAFKRVNDHIAKLVSNNAGELGSEVSRMPQTAIGPPKRTVRRLAGHK